MPGNAEQQYLLTVHIYHMYCIKLQSCKFTTSEGDQAAASTALPLPLLHLGSHSWLYMSQQNEFAPQNSMKACLPEDTLGTWWSLNECNTDLKCLLDNPLVTRTAHEFVFLIILRYTGLQWLHQGIHVLDCLTVCRMLLLDWDLLSFHSLTILKSTSQTLLWQTYCHFF